MSAHAHVAMAEDNKFVAQFKNICALKYILISFFTLIIANNKMWADIHEHSCIYQLLFYMLYINVFSLTLHFLNAHM